MTQEEVKKRAELYTALADGKTIQDWTNDTWKDKEYTSFGELSQSPIKSQPKYRPFKTQEECWNEMLKHQPFGWVIGKIYANFHHIDFVYICNPNNGYGVRLSNNAICTNFEHMFKDYKFADGTPFGIKEE